MELMKTSELINEAFKMGFVMVSLHVRDTDNNSHFITVREEQDVDAKISRMNELIGEGHRVLAITFL